MTREDTGEARTAEASTGEQQSLCKDNFIKGAGLLHVFVSILKFSQALFPRAIFHFTLYLDAVAPAKCIYLTFFN